MDFGVLPPEINSGRMYTGPGPGPMLAAAAAWDGLAAELHNTASAYDSVISGLTSGSWQGPTSAAMGAAAAPYVAWMNTTAAQAEQTATQARAAVAAYEMAFAATVPPPVIAANRAQLMALIATNILGQNTPAIMATEAQYTEMWAQDAAAMYGYAGSSATTTSQMMPFSPPPPTTNTAGQAMQAAAVSQATSTSAGTGVQSTLSQVMSAVPSALQSLAPTGSSPVSSAAAPSAAAASATPQWVTDLNNFTTFIGAAFGNYTFLGTLPPYGVPFLLGIQSVLLPQNAQGVAHLLGVAAKPATGALAPLQSMVSPGVGLGGGASTVSASVGRAGAVGGLSVPHGWTSAAPAIRTVAAVWPGTGMGAAPAAAAEGQGSLFSDLALSGMAGRAIGGTGFGSVGGGASRSLTGSLGGVVADDAATTATIIVIPPLDE